ncbi:MAG: helix-turn-helix domain-containing protein [Candidatus Cryptobacteroides sp.]
MELQDILDMFKCRECGWSGACGKDFVMFGNPVFLTERMNPYKSEYTIVILCEGGQAYGCVNLQEYHLQENGLMVILPGAITEMRYISDDFRATYIIASESFQNSLAIGNSFRLRQEMQQRPLRFFSGESLDAIKTYFTMSRRILDAADNPNRMEIIRLMTKAFFLGLGYYIHKDMEPANMSRESEITERFLSLVEKNYSRDRSVSFYADKMAITHKYLSMCVKSSSGKTPLEWIENYVVLDARAQLASTTRTVQQISDSLGFSSQSDFGRYFKRVTGLSPKAYRAMMKG